MADQQLVARIKRNSKYWGQTAPNAWFNVRVVEDTHYQLRGNNNNYRFSDVVMGIRFEGGVVDFKTGKRTKIAKTPPAEISECPACKEQYRDGQTCRAVGGRGGCPMGGDF